MTDGDEHRLREAVTTGQYPALRDALDNITKNTFDARFEDGINRILH